MRSSDQGGGPPKDLAQLLRLREVRVETAQAAVRVQRDACEQAAAAVQARQQHIADNRRDVARHAAYAVGAGASDLPRLSALFGAFREQLDDTLERNEYGLVDDEETLEESESQLLERRQAWMREQSRRDGVEEALQRSRRAIARQAENLTDNEADELRRRSPLTPKTA